MNPADSANVELQDLIKLFFEDLSLLGQFEEVAEEDIPEPSHSLLAHDQHMTVTVERHHESSVDVSVLASRTDGEYYARKILLSRKTDGRVVQYGIVRLNKALIDPIVRAEIEQQETPLGRILINHNVMRAVKLLNLFKIQCGAELAREFGFKVGQVCFGRTALIYCDGAPAIELLEIVS